MVTTKTTPTKTTKAHKPKSAPTTDVASAPPPAPVNTSIKVLKNGVSWHGGRFDWSLPQQQPDGSWTPGDWTPDCEPSLCESGYHLTHDPGRWWGDGENVTAYLAEYDGPTDGPNPESEDDPTKFTTTRARLLRPLTFADLEAKGIYLAGEHGVIDKGRLIVGGTAHLAGVEGDARIDMMYGSARIDWMYGSARIDWMYGSARIDMMCGSARIDRMCGSARIDMMCGSARIDRMDGSARIDRMCGSARIDWMDGSATAHACAAAVLVLGGGSPTVTLRDRAACLDYRARRPVAHIAPEQGVLTLGADGSATVAPETAEGATT